MGNLLRVCAQLAIVAYVGLKFYKFSKNKEEMDNFKADIKSLKNKYFGCKEKQSAETSTEENNN